jgi:hypothetical protein
MLTSSRLMASAIALTLAVAIAAPSIAEEITTKKVNILCWSAEGVHSFHNALRIFRNPDHLAALMNEAACGFLQPGGRVEVGAKIGYSEIL